MRYSSTPVLSMVAGLIFFAGCGSDSKTAEPSNNNPIDDNPLLINGTYTGTSASAGSEIMVLWVTNSSQEYQYGYKLGEGTVGDGTYTITLAEELPAEVVGFFGVAVGFIVTAPNPSNIQNGILDKDSFDKLLTTSPEQVIIWRPSNAVIDTDRAPWAESFPDGYSCGQCLPIEGNFDGYEIMDCSEAFKLMNLQEADETNAFCNWG